MPQEHMTMVDRAVAGNEALRVVSTHGVEGGELIIRGYVAANVLALSALISVQEVRAYIDSILPGPKLHVVSDRDDLNHAYPVNTYKRRDPLDVETEAEMKILTAMFRARDDGTITSHFRAQNMTGDDVLPMLKKVRADLDTEIALVENCPAVRAKYADATT